MDIGELGIEEYGRFYANYRGVVENVEDPDNLGRLQVLVPQVYGDDLYEYWAAPKLFAGAGIGSFILPNKGDFVWVEFENGDPRYPIWSYGWWGQGQVPEGASPLNKVIQTTTGHRVELDDENMLVRITDANKNIVELNSNGVSIISENISIGSLDKSDEPAVLGDTAMDLLIEFMNDLGNIATIQTSSGVTYAINTSPNWSSLSSKWGSKWEEFKSKSVTLNK